MIRSAPLADCCSASNDPEAQGNCRRRSRRRRDARPGRCTIDSCVGRGWLPAVGPRLDLGIRSRCSQETRQRLQPSLAILRVAVLASDDQNPNPFPVLAIDHRIGEVLKSVNSPHFVHGRAEPWKLNQQTRYSVELVKKPTCELGAAFVPIEARCFEEIKLGASMQAERHATAALIRARASGPDTSSDGSASAWASRCAARAFHFASLARSESRLEIT